MAAERGRPLPALPTTQNPDLKEYLDYLAQLDEFFANYRRRSAIRPTLYLKIEEHLAVVREQRWGKKSRKALNEAYYYASALADIVAAGGRRDKHFYEDVDELWRQLRLILTFNGRQRAPKPGT